MASADDGETPGRARPSVPRSALADVCWPALPDPPGARMLALQYQLDASQWWPEARLREAQLRQLTLLARHARETVPLYAERLAHLDLSRDLDAATFASIPILSREDIQRGFEALTSRRVPPAHGRTFDGETSGSTARPVRYRSTELADFFWHVFTLRDHLWHQRDFSAKLASIRSRVEPGTASGWGASTDVAYRTGPVATCNTEMPLSEQAQWLLRENPEYLISVASNARGLAQYCGERGLRPTNLREVRTYGEALNPDMRATCRAAWNAPVVDIYSCREAGYLALQCPHREHYHVQSEGIWLEVLDAQGAPCRAGETGRIVITPLHNFAMPLMRYEIGDYAQVGPACACGRGLPVLSRILGRVRNMLRLANGDTLWPRFGEARFGAVAPVLQFQVIQKSFAELEVRLVVARVLSAAEEQNLRDHLLRHLGHPFRVLLSYLESIPRSASGKYEDFRCEIGAARDDAGSPGVTGANAA